VLLAADRRQGKPQAQTVSGGASRLGLRQPPPYSFLMANVFYFFVDRTCSHRVDHEVQYHVVKDATSYFF